MANREEILNELKEISLTVANIGNKNPFHVPMEYFETLPVEVMSRVSDHGEEEGNPSWVKPEQNAPFEVPAGYFEGLAETILNLIRASEASSHKEELNIISPLLDRMEKTVPFNLPAGYFDEFPGDVMAGVHAIDYVNRELETSSMTINDLKDKNVFQVPEGYFSNLSEQLLTKVKGRQKGKVFHLMPVKKVIRYAAAALIAGIVSVGAWTFFRENASINQAAEISGIEKISNAEMERYLETSSVAPAESNTEVNSVTSSDLKDEDMQELLADVSDEELQEYLDQHAVAKDLNTN